MRRFGMRLAILASTTIVLALATAAAAKPRTWYVSAAAHVGGTGSRHAPLGSLAAVARASRAGDRIVVLPAPAAHPLDGGIALKPRQQLVGAGRAVAGHTNKLAVLPAIENTDASRLAGDAIRLAKGATVRNIAVLKSVRGDIYGLDATGVRLIGNDLTGQNSSCRPGFLVQPFNVPTGIPGTMIPASPAVAPQNAWAALMLDGQKATGTFDIERNVVHDGACGDGIDVRALGTSKLTGTLRRNLVTRLKQGPGAGTPSKGSISSVLAIGMQALDTGVLRVTQTRNTETTIGSPGADCEGQFANVAGSGTLHDSVDRNTFAHGIGGTSCNGFETIVSTGNGTIVARLTNSTFRDNQGDMFEEGNLGAGSTMRFTMDYVVADTTHQRGANPPGSSDGGSNAIPFNLGDCMVAGNDGGADSTTLVIRHSTLAHCNNGVSLLSNVGNGNGSGPTKTLAADISDSVITANGKYGIHVATDTPVDTLHVKIARTEISGNDEPGASFEAQALAVGQLPGAALDLGGGALHSAGGNCLFGNGTTDVEATNTPVVARSDWWGAPGAPKREQTTARETGSVDTAGALSARPPCGLG
jgi:hypothetical protein